jgi:peptide deformylase
LLRKDPIEFDGRQFIVTVSMGVSSFPTDCENMHDLMIETMAEYNGVGLAAPQVHQGVRLFIASLDTGEEGTPVVEPPPPEKKKTEEMKEELQATVALIQEYVPPAPDKMQV